MIGPAGAGRDNVTGGAGTAVGSCQPQVVGREPHLGLGRGPSSADVGAAELLAGGPGDPGVPEPNPARLRSPNPSRTLTR
jgi:hypothetical protein